MPFNTLSGPVGKVKSKETIDYVKPQSNNKDGFKPKSSELKKTKRNTRGLSEGPTDSSHVQFVSSMAQFIKGRVYFDCPRTVHTQIPESVHLLNVDNDHVYTPFYADFGPLNLANVYRFCQMFKAKLENPALTRKAIVLYTTSQPDKCTNIALLLCSYFVLEENWTPDEVKTLIIRPLSSKSHLFPFVAYRDAGYGPATYWIGILDCLRALYKGIIVQNPPLFNWDNFDIEEYEFYEKVENGDINFIIPGFFMALATPHDDPPPHLVRYHAEVEKGNIAPLHPGLNTKRFKPVYQLGPLIEYFKFPHVNVKSIIRLNNKLYDRQRFIDAGINHYELYFPDGSVPPWDTIVKKFMLIADSHAPLHLLPPEHQAVIRASMGNKVDTARGSLAIHCKAGLGRTGTLICCWMIKTLGWSAKDCISWCRLMRPGSVVGPQQNWLEAMEGKLLQWGEQERKSFQAMGTSLNAALNMSHIHEDASAENLHLETNLGTEAIAETTMGMQVPAQPRKDKLVLQTTVDVDMNGPPSPDTKLTGNKWSVVQEKDILNSFGETDHHYNLRTEDISGAIQKSSANARSKMHETKEKSPNLKRKEAKKRDEVVDMETK